MLGSRDSYNHIDIPRQQLSLAQTGGTMPDFFQPSARTSVLTNSYLLHFVFLYLWSDSYPERFKFARCATVCRQFHESVIRILWKKLEGLFPLWHLLAPPDTKCPKRYSFKDQPEIDRAHYLHQVSTRALRLRLSLMIGHDVIAGHNSPPIRRSRSMEALSVACHPCPSHRILRWHGG